MSRNQMLEDQEIPLENVMESVLPEDTEETDQSQQQYTKTPEDSAQKSWSGFKIVSDNIDKTVFASLQRLDDNITRSLHYFHAYARRTGSISQDYRILNHHNVRWTWSLCYLLSLMLRLSREKCLYYCPGTNKNLRKTYLIDSNY